MGISASSLLDETKSNYIKGQAEAELKEFSPCYRKQFSVAYFSQVQDDLEQHKETITQLLKQREAPVEGEVLYEEGVLFFDETRKWRERYIVVRANYCLECHDSLESFVKGVTPRQKLLPTGGTALTTEEKYMAMVDKCFPDDTNNVKEDFSPPLSGMPGQFPVYLRLPYRRDSYFCFRQEAKQAGFLSILSDCIRHQNQDFLKKKTCEVQAFLKAVQLYRQDKGKYEAWNMLMGSDVRVMANLVMEKLLPSLEKDMLPRLKAKKTERKRVWFATVEAAYILVQEQLLEGLSAMKEECRTTARQQEVLIHSDMDQINNTRTLLEGKIRASVSEPAERFCAESVQPYLASVLDELMEPISSGFQEARQLSDSMMDQLYQEFQAGAAIEDVKKALSKLSRPNLQSCYQKISSLQEKLNNLQERFGFSNINSLIHSTQIDLQQLMENSAYTFEQLLSKAIEDNPDIAGSVMEKAKHRVLKQYDYDSSTIRKRLFQEALVAITLPHIKKNLAPTCKAKLQDLEQFVDTDHSSFIHVENVYEDILLQILDKEVTKVVKDAANLKKHNLFTDSRDLLSQSSRSSLSSPSSPGSPARVLGASAPPSPDPSQAPAQPAPLLTLAETPSVEEQKEETLVEAEEPAAEVAPVSPEKVAGEVEEKVAEKIAEDVVQQVAEEIAVKAEEEVAEQIAEEVAEKVGEKIAQEVEEKVAEVIAVDVEQKVAEVNAENVEVKVAEAIAEGVEVKVAEAIAEDVEVKVAEVIAEDVEVKVAEVIPEDVEEKVAEVIPEDIQEKVAEVIAEDVEEKVVENIAEKVEEMVTSPIASATQQEEEIRVVESIAEDVPVPVELPKEEAASAGDDATQAEPDKADTLEAPETVTTEQTVISETAKQETFVESDVQSTEAPIEVASSDALSSVESAAVEAEAEEAAAAEQCEAPVSNPDPTPSSGTETMVKQSPEDAVAENIASLTVTSSEETTVSVPPVTASEGDAPSVTVCESSPENELEAPPCGGDPVTAPVNGSLEAKTEAEEPVNISGPSSLNVSVGTESPSLDVDSFECSKEPQSSDDEVSATSDLGEDEVRLSESPISSDEAPAEAMEVTTETPVTTGDELSPEAHAGDINTLDAEEDTKEDPNANVESETSVSAQTLDAQTPVSTELAKGTTAFEEAASPEPEPMDSIKGIRDLVVEVIEVEELVQRYPSGIPKDGEE